MYMDFIRIRQHTLRYEHKLIYACKYSVAFTAQAFMKLTPT
jgi:hypothetical protein